MNPAKVALGCLVALISGCGAVDGGAPLDISEDALGISIAGSLPSGAAISATPPGAVGSPVCVAATPQSCNLAKNQEPPPPPPSIKLLGCTVQVALEEVSVTTGQGASEGSLEVSVVAQSGGDQLSWPESGEVDMAVPNTKRISETVTEYALQPNEKRKIDVCASVTEDDDGGANGAPDFGSDCETVEISCKLAKTGPLSVDVVTPLCQGSRLDKDGNCKTWNGEVTSQFRVAVSDEDWDNVPNDEDATPEPEDEACRGQEGRAVVLFAEFGASDLNDLVGLIGMGVDQLVKEYDFVAIATDPLHVGPFTLRQDTLANADMVVPPTLEGLTDAFRVATANGFDITFFNLAHGGADAAGEAFFTSTDPGGFIFESDLSVSLSPERFGTCDVPFRAVTSLACYFSHMNAMWIDRGAKVVDGALATNFWPQQLSGFGRHWNDGDNFGTALSKSDNPVVQTLNSLAIELVGDAYGQVSGCTDSVLELNDCARAFFTTDGPVSVGFANNGRYDYDDNASGADNMARGSTQIVAGNPMIDKFTPLTW